MRRFLRILWKTMKLLLLVFFVFFVSLFFHAQRIPVSWVLSCLDGKLPPGVDVQVDSVAFGFVHGLHVRGLRVYDRSCADPASPIVSARSVVLYPFQRHLEIDALTYPRLPDSYYAPGNKERNEPLEVDLPQIERFSLVLKNPKILSVAPERLVADVAVVGRRLEVDRIHLTWPNPEEVMSIDGFCRMDLDRQVLEGEARGSAKQANVRPLLDALDIPVSLPYMDAFTETPGRIPATCAWSVNLVNNDLDLVVGVDANLGKYNGVSLRHGKGDISLQVRTRRTSLNYHNVIGPVVATGAKGESLEGTVVIDGVDGTNDVSVVAKSRLPVAHLLKVAGFTGDYLDESVCGDASCDLHFRFPRTMGRDYSQLSGRGSFSIRNGQLMRMKGFAGLLELMAEHVPGVSTLTDTTQASCDYVIENGVLKSDNIYIEGSVFSIKMFGQHDLVNDKLDFTVRVQFTKSDSLAGKILHPLTWPFTKLLLEFRLSGTSGDPQWHYINILDRVLEVTK